MNTQPASAYARPIPRGVLFYVAFLAVLSANTTLLGYFEPGILFGYQTDWINAAPVTAFYATRNLAILVLCLAGLSSRNAGVLFSALLVRLVVETVDLGFALRFGLVPLPAPVTALAWAAVFTVPQMYCLWRLRAHGPGWRFEFAEEVTVSASRAAVWAKLAAHQEMPRWVKLGLKKVVLLPDGDAQPGTPGSLRRIWFAGWPAVTERFCEVVPEQRYSYAVIGGMPHLRDHLGTVSLDGDEDGVRVRWAIRFVFHPFHPLSWVAPLFVASFQKVVGSGLAELKRQLEAEAA